MVQHDLNGKEISFEKIVSEKTVYYGSHFCLSVTETGAAEIDKQREDGDNIAPWIAKHMRVKEPMPVGEEGTCFQEDISRFKEQLEKGTRPE